MKTRLLHERSTFAQGAGTRAPKREVESLELDQMCLDISAWAVLGYPKESCYRDELNGFFTSRWGIAQEQASPVGQGLARGFNEYYEPVVGRGARRQAEDVAAALTRGLEQVTIAVAELRRAVEAIGERLQVVEHRQTQDDETPLTLDPWRAWIDQNRDVLRQYPDQYVAFDLRRGVVVAERDEAEFTRRLTALGDEAADLYTTHTSIYF